jgi:hypothetical protein
LDVARCRILHGIKATSIALQMSPEPLKWRIWIAPGDWTPVHRDVFTDVFPALRQKRAAVLYAVLYDRVRHNDFRAVRASVAQLARWSGLNERTVKKCITELREHKFILRKKHGTKHSYTDKPLWRVPLTEFNPKFVSWVPVPRFIITRYCSHFFGCVLLLGLLRYQHVGWRNDCWVGVPRLSKDFGWSQTTVRELLRTMFRDDLWKPRGTGLPRPLDMVWQPSKDGGERRRFRVLAVWYDRKSTRGRGYCTFRVSSAFSRRFHISTTLGFEEK